MSKFLVQSTAIGLFIGLAAGAALFSLPGRDAAAEPLHPNPLERPAVASSEDRLGTLQYVATTEFAVAGAGFAPRRATVSHSLRVGRGDTLMDLLVDAGVARREAHEAICA